MFVESLKNDNCVNITDAQMTRFWIKISDAAHFVSGRTTGTGGLHIPPMKAASITLIAETVAAILNISSYKTNHIGVRPGEKQHECLRTSYEGEEMHSNTCEQFNREQLIDLLRPIVKAFT